MLTSMACFMEKKRKIVLDNVIKSLREIVSHAKKSKVHVMLENVPLSNGIHNINEFKYIIDNVICYLFILTFLMLLPQQEWSR